MYVNSGEFFGLGLCTETFSLIFATKKGRLLSNLMQKCLMILRFETLTRPYVAVSKLRKQQLSNYNYKKQRQTHQSSCTISEIKQRHHKKVDHRRLYLSVVSFRQICNSVIILFIYLV